MAALTALKKLDDKLECSLCLEQFREPKILPCFHVFCKSPCLEGLVSRDGHSLTCPTCRHVVQLSEKGVAGLQSDFHIDHLLEIKEAFSSPDLVQSPGSTNSLTELCGNCAHGNASGYCNDCHQYLCDECQDAHKLLKITKNHRLSSTGSQSDVSGSLTSSGSTGSVMAQFCTSHPSKKLKMYCETCKELICSRCTIHTHSGHSYNLIATLFPRHREELVASLEPLRTRQEQLQLALLSFEERAREIRERSVNIEAEIHKEVDRQLQLLDERRDTLLGDLKNLTQKKLESLGEQRNEVKSTLDNINSHLEDTESSLDNEAKDELLQIKPELMANANKIEEQCEELDIDPNTTAEIELISTNTEDLAESCKEFLEVIDGQTFSAENSILEEVVDTTTARSLCHLTLQALARDLTVFRGSLDIQAELVHSTSGESQCCEVERQKFDGQYRISYQPKTQGSHTLEIRAKGRSVKGSPISITVVPGEPIKSISNLRQPRDTATNSRGHIVALVNSGNSVLVLSQDGDKLLAFGKQGSKPGQLNDAYGITVDKSDNIYVTDNQNHRIQKFDSQGGLIACIGSRGSNCLQFHHPIGICYNPRDDCVYVADQCNHRIQVLTTDLNYLRRFGTKGKTNGQYQHIFAIDFDQANNLYVADHLNHRVQVVTTEGRFIRSFTRKENARKLSPVRSLVVDKNGLVYVSEQEGNCILVYNYEGVHISTLGSKGSTAMGQYNNIQGLSIDHNDHLIVSDSGNGRLQIY